MGWLWKTQNTGDAPPKPSSEGSIAEPSTSFPPQPSEKPRPALSRDEEADLELRNLLKQLELEQNAAVRTSRKHLTDGSDQSSTAAAISPESLYPTTMSCREAFDLAFYCQSLGGQFTNLYRYGGMRDCSENWSNFWFCMRTKSQPEGKKATMIQEHYRQRAAKYKTCPSSEDIWEVRKEPLVGAFMEDPDAVPDERPSDRS